MNRRLWTAALALGLLSGAVSAQTRIFQLTNPFPFPIEVRILGDGPQFPSVVKMPAGGGGATVPVPYPDLTMRLQIKQPNGQWSTTLKLPWKAGKITLPMP